MLNENSSVDSLIEGVKGTTGVLSSLISRKFGLVFAFVVLGLVVSKLLLG